MFISRILRATIFAAALMAYTGGARAANVTPDVIFGTGNANGSFTVDTGEGVELGLRGKLRYDLSSMPQNTFNWDGIRTYTFDPLLGNAPDAGLSIWNFEWSINTDVGGSVGRNLDDLTYLLTIDFDPSASVNGISGDPIFPLLPDPADFPDHAIGDNLTGNGAGTVATSAGDYAALIAANNVAQNSWNLGFFTPGNPQLPGIYTISLEAFIGEASLAMTSIDIVVTPVPLPAALPLLAGALGLLGFAGWRRRRVAV